MDDRLLIEDELWDARPDAHLTPGAAKHALDDLYARTRRFQTSDGFSDLMRFIGSFRFYSPYNAMLVYIQKPGAHFVARADVWQKEYGRTIKANAQILIMLQPMSPVMFVYDVSDTEGRELPTGVTEPFAVEGTNVDTELSLTSFNAERDGVRVSEVAYGSQQAGALRRARSSLQFLMRERRADVPLRYEITLDSHADVKSRYATLVHELGHLYCGHIGTPDESWWPDRRDTSSETREFEAESVAHLVCTRAGLRIQSDGYLSGYLSGPNRQLPPISLEQIIKATSLIEEMGKRRLPDRKPGEKKKGTSTRK